MNTLNTIDEYIQSKITLINAHLDKLVPENNSPYNILFKAARYSLLSDGKKIRPILALAATETLKGNSDAAIQPACALEMIHTYSLIHDDLPCMDDDDFRRGKPSLHKAFTEAQAILAGDFLLTHAFEIISTAPDLTSQQKVELSTILSRNAGSSGMIGGQIMDIEAEGKPIDIDFLRQIHERKTGALITASLEFGAIIANANSQDRELIKQFGHLIGLAFQIADDVLDVTSCKNSDVKNNKTTYVTLLGTEKAKDLSKNYYQEAVSKLEQLPYDTFLLKSIADRLIGHI